MRRGWLALPVLAVTMACTPLKDYQEAARQLRFHLDRVEPSLHVSLPVDRSRIGFRVVLGVENPSTVPFHVVGFTGDLMLDNGGGMRSIGHLELTRALELPAGGQGQLDTELSFSYQDLRDNWVAIQSAAKGGAGTWHLEGALKAEVYGLPIKLPVRTSRPYGSHG
jgi:LEA14-like dessication related protein